MCPCASLPAPAGEGVPERRGRVTWATRGRQAQAPGGGGGPEARQSQSGSPPPTRPPQAEPGPRRLPEGKQGRGVLGPAALGSLAGQWQCPEGWPGWDLILPGSTGSDLSKRRVRWGCPPVPQCAGGGVPEERPGSGWKDPGGNRPLAREAPGASWHRVGALWTPRLGCVTIQIPAEGLPASLAPCTPSIV